MDQAAALIPQHPVYECQQSIEMPHGGHGVLQGDPQPEFPIDHRFYDIVGPILQQALENGPVGFIEVPAPTVPETDNIALWRHRQFEIVPAIDQGRKLPGKAVKPIHVLLEYLLPIYTKDGIYMEDVHGLGALKGPFARIV